MKDHDWSAARLVVYTLIGWTVVLAVSVCGQ